MKRYNAKRQTLAPGYRWARQVEIDYAKVAAIQAHIRAGGKLPPAVVVMYGDYLLPLDGHHRTVAHDRERRLLDAYVIPGRVFDRLDAGFGSRAEDSIYCDGIPCMAVAAHWMSSAQVLTDGRQPS